MGEAYVGLDNYQDITGGCLCIICSEGKKEERKKERVLGQIEMIIHFLLLQVRR